MWSKEQNFPLLGCTKTGTPNFPKRLSNEKPIDFLGECVGYLSISFSLGTFTFVTEYEVHVLIH